MGDWIKENYEKAALGGAAVVALAVGAVVLLGGDDQNNVRSRGGAPDNNTDIPAFSELAQVLEQRQGKVSMIDTQTDVFVGQDLYAKENSEQPVDLEVSPPVHEGIENAWWKKYDIDPGFANAPSRDADNDGFTNREEHDEGTNPVDASSHPELIDKLLANEVDAFRYRIRWSEFAKPQITLRYLDINGVQVSEQAAPGSVVFEKGPMKDRFKLGERVELEDPTGKMQDAYVLTDQSELRKGQKLTLFKRGLTQGSNEFSDKSVTLRLNALGKSGSAFKLEEGERFSLPYDPDAAEKPYRLKSIERQGDSDTYSLLFEYENKGGQKETHRMEAKASQ